MQEDYYDILGVKRDASQDDIKKAFRKLSVKWHPDKWANSSEEEKKKAEDNFKKISEAYNTLSNPDKKKNYDRGSNSNGGFDPFEAGYGDIFERVRNMHGFGGHRTHDNLDIRADVNVTVEEVYNGAIKKVKYKRHHLCTHCNGTGAETKDDITICPYCGGKGVQVRTETRGSMFVQNMTQCTHCGGTGKFVKNKCHVCGGTGYEDVEEEISVPLDGGITEGMYIQFEGNGNISDDGMYAGSLYVVFHVVPSDGFSIVSGYNIEKTIDVDVFDCITGTSQKVKKPDGTVISIKLKPGVRHGDVMRVSGCGLKNQNGNRGDLYIRVNQVMPVITDKNLSKKLGSVKSSVKEWKWKRT